MKHARAIFGALAICLMAALSAHAEPPQPGSVGVVLERMFIGCQTPTDLKTILDAAQKDIEEGTEILMAYRNEMMPNARLRCDHGLLGLASFGTNVDFGLIKNPKGGYIHGWAVWMKNAHVEYWILWTEPVHDKDV